MQSQISEAASEASKSNLEIRIGIQNPISLPWYPEPQDEDRVIV